MLRGSIAPPNGTRYSTALSYLCLFNGDISEGLCKVWNIVFAATSVRLKLQGVGSGIDMGISWNTAGINWKSVQKTVYINMVGINWKMVH